MMQDEWEIARLRREAQEWKTKAETADMTEEEKYKYLYEQSQKELAAAQWEQTEFVNRLAQRQRMADLAGIDAGELAQGRISKKKRAAPPVAPQAPPAPAPVAEDIMALSPSERRNRLDKMSPDQFKRLMETLGEED